MVFEYGPQWTGEFTWIIYIAFVVAFLVAFGMGANDCANSYGTVVGSGVLKLWKAYILATVFETLGATLLVGQPLQSARRYSWPPGLQRSVSRVKFTLMNQGYKVTNTMRKSIVNVSVYDVYSRAAFNSSGILQGYRSVESCDHSVFLAENFSVAGSYLSPNCTTYTAADFMLGELGVLIGTAFWLILATVIHLPVSTTHCAVGATIGFSLVLKGTDGINWWIILNIVISWIASPAMAGFFSVVFYLVIKYTVFNRAYPFESSLQMMPIFYFFALTVNSFSILYHGSKYLHFDELKWWECLLISLAIGVFVAVFMLIWGKDLVRRRVLRKMSALPEPKIGAVNRDILIAVENPSNGKETKNGNHQLAGNGLGSKTGSATNWKDVSSSDARFPQTNGNGVLNDSGLEMTPSRTSKFQTRNTSTNGSTLNDLAPTPYLKRREDTSVDAKSLKEKVSLCNAVAPLVAMYLVYEHGNADIELKYDYSMILLILFGAISMIIGLWILGHKVISTIGTKITQVTPPSGFAMELGTGFTVLVASKIGIPVSTTHCAVGAVVCVGWFKSNEGGVSWKTFRNIAIAWVVTLPVASAVAALAAYLLKIWIL
uniref:Phosphate transporter n=1 Tax=Romanomermis culicivorax TaxID=13658 RepID=A0A915HRW2_ROMCU